MPTQAEIYGYGTIANVICCICSLGGAVIFPCARRHAKAYHLVLSIFMGLAVGTLGSDAVIHLIPEAFGLHGHGNEHETETVANETAHEEDDHNDHDDHGDHGDGIHIDPYVWYCLVIMAGVYGFYLLEMLMTFFKYGLNSEDDDGTPAVLSSISSTPIDGFSQISESVSTYTINETKVGNGNTNTNTKNDGEKQCCQSISSLAIMIIVGDAIHNFADGLAVAAAFSSTILEGISITIAIFCHELPHELGDFAVLVGSGMSFGKALLANLLSSLTAMVGFYVGVPISVDEGARNWIFAITAGMFLYISLVDMLPSLIQRSKGSLKTFIFHNIGIILGALIITLLGIFEGKVSL